MSSELQAANNITVEELEVSLVRAMKEITATMLNCTSEIVSPDQVDVIPPDFPRSLGWREDVGYGRHSFVAGVCLHWQEPCWE